MATNLRLPMLIPAAIWTAQLQSMEAGSIKFSVIKAVKNAQNMIDDSPTPEMDPIVLASDRVVN